MVVGGLLVLTVPEAWRWCWAGFALAALLTMWWADRSARWPSAAPLALGRPVGPRRLRALCRPLVAAVVAGAGCAGVWTFGRDLLAVEGGVPTRVTGLLWCVLGGAGLLGGISGVLVGRIGLRAAWGATVVVAAAGTAGLAVAPDDARVAAVGLACFGAAFVALSGVLIAWGAHREPDSAPAAAATLFIGFTVGQAAGSVLLGSLAGWVGMPGAFAVAAGVLLASGAAAEPRTAGAHRGPGERPGVPAPMV
ncbi:hypothetical protein [Blastococcus sp. CCUG 61487]|uniref:hypothetical protein n=1 Tax=Blastococcus sp. CCUG 61487 TaxID=1840703 RepID=UPI00201D91D6|nr:hypothetical protein [Blastococcus sp. CCUG 61487]